MKCVIRVVLLALFASLPSLDEEASQQVRQDQQHFNTSLTSESRARFFPPHGNSKPGRLMGLPHHFMTQYQPYLYKQLLEAINPARDPLLELQVQRQKFEQQLKNNSAHIPEEEYALSSQFLSLHRQVVRALEVTRQAEGGADALQRFDAAADPEISYAKTYG